MIVWNLLLKSPVTKGFIKLPLLITMYVVRMNIISIKFEAFAFEFKYARGKIIGVTKSLIVDRHRATLL